MTGDYERTDSMKTQREALIIGAGNIGKGPIALFLKKNRYRLTFASRSFDKLQAIQETGYTIHTTVLREQHQTFMDRFDIAPLSGDHFDQAFLRADSVFICLYPDAYASMAQALMHALTLRYQKKRDQKLNLVLCSNNLFSKDILLEELYRFSPSPEIRTWMTSAVGIARMLVSVGSRPLLNNPDDVEINLTNFKIEVEAGALVDPLAVPEFQGVPDIRQSYFLKLYLINAPLFYLAIRGLAKGYTLMNEVIQDQGLLELIRLTRLEIEAALLNEFRLDPLAVRTLSDQGFQKLLLPSDEKLSRLTKRTSDKLTRDERIMGPALLALKHGVSPDLCTRNIAAFLDLAEVGVGTLERNDALIREGRMGYLTRKCGLTSEEIRWFTPRLEKRVY